MKKQVSELVKVIEESKNEEWIKYWNEFKEEYMKAYKKGEYTLESYLKQILYLAKYVVSKVKPKEKTPDETNYDNALQRVKDKLPTGGDVLDAFEEFCKSIEDKDIKEQTKILNRIATLIESDGEIPSLLTHIPNRETALELFKKYVKASNAKAKELAVKATKN